jgi:hypothetical protein
MLSPWRGSDEPTRATKEAEETGGKKKSLRSAPKRTREGGRRRRSASGLQPDTCPEGFAVLKTV